MKILSNSLVNFTTRMPILRFENNNSITSINIAYTIKTYYDA